jgi:hypothetical protein
VRARAALAAALLAGAGVAAWAGPAPAQATPGASQWQTLTDHFPGLATTDADLSAADQVGDGAHVVRYRGTNAAAVVDAGGHRRIVLSTRPLRATDDDGQPRPVDLSLVTDDDAGRPANAPFALELDRRQAGSFTLGPDAEHAITVTPAVTWSTAPSTPDDQLFFAQTAPATDTLVRPTVDGVETFDQLRSPGAPERFAWHLDLAPGQRAVARDGGVVVVEGDREVVAMQPPAAVDAADRKIATEAHLEGDDTVVVEVRHRDAEASYPVVLDPSWSSSYDYADRPGVGLQGWHGDEGPALGGPWYGVGTNADPDPGIDPTRSTAGLIIKPYGGKVYPVDAYGRLSWPAPPTTRILRASWRHVTAFNDHDRQTLRLALYGGESPPVVYDHFDTDPGFVDHDIDQPAFGQPDARAQSAVMWMFTPPCDSGDSDCPRAIPTNPVTLGRVGSVDLVLSDDTAPGTSATGPLRDLAGTWSRGSGSAALTMGASDDGSGVLSYRLDDSDVNGTHLLHPVVGACDPTTASRCRTAASAPRRAPRRSAPTSAPCPRAATP